MFVIKVKRR